MQHAENGNLQGILLTQNHLIYSRSLPCVGFGGWDILGHIGLVEQALRKRWPGNRLQDNG